MNEHYEYDELYGTLLHKNPTDTERTYFVIECQYWKFYKWMYLHGWNKVKYKTVNINELIGYEVTLIK